MQLTEIYDPVEERPQYSSRLARELSRARWGEAGGPADTVTRDMQNEDNTELSEEQFGEYQKWSSANKLYLEKYQYDTQGLWLAIKNREVEWTPGGALPDRFKKRNHPTFSKQSQYSGKDGNVGGSWNEDGSFTPGGILSEKQAEWLQGYFEKHHPGAKLNIAGHVEHDQGKPVVQRDPTEPGLFDGMLDAPARGFVSGLLSTGSNILSIASWLGAENDLNKTTKRETWPEQQQRSMLQAAADLRQYIRETWDPDPEKMGEAAQIVHGLFNVIPRAALYSTVGPWGGAALTAADLSLYERETLGDKGVSDTVRNAAFAWSFLANLIGFRLPPALGASRTQSALYGLVTNAGADAGERLGLQWILNGAGYEEIADQYQITPVSLAVSAALGGVFGGIGWRSPRGREVTKEQTQKAARVEARAKELAPEYKEAARDVLDNYPARVSQLLPELRETASKLANPEGGKAAAEGDVEGFALFIATMHATREEVLGVKGLPRAVFVTDLAEQNRYLAEVAKFSRVPMGPAFNDPMATVGVVALQGKKLNQRAAKSSAQKLLSGEEGKNAAPFAGILNAETGMRLKAGRELVGKLFSNTREDKPFFSKYAESLPEIVSKARRIESSHKNGETRHVFGAAVQEGGERHWVEIRAKEVDGRPGMLEIESVKARLLDADAPVAKEGEKLTQSLMDALWKEDRPEVAYVRADGGYYFTYTPDDAYKEGGVYNRPGGSNELYQLVRPKDVDPEKILTAKDKTNLGKLKKLSKEDREKLAKEVATIKAMYTVTESAKVLGSPDEGWAELIFKDVATYSKKDIAKEREALRKAETEEERKKIVVHRVGEIKRDSDGDLIIRWETHSYDFMLEDPSNPKSKAIKKWKDENKPQTPENWTPEYRERVETLATKVVDELLKVLDRNKNGDKAALKIILQSDWYRGFLKDLREGYGGSAHALSEQQGATSPNTPVKDNMDNAVDLIRRAARGDFDDLLEDWRKWDSDRAAAQKDIADFVALKKSGPLTEADVEDMKKNLASDMRERIEKARREAMEKAPKGAEKEAADKAEAAAREAGPYKELEKDLAKLSDPEGAEEIRQGKDGVPANKHIMMLSGYRSRIKTASDLSQIADKLLPRKENGKKYGFNSGNALRAILGHWGEVRNADTLLGVNGTAPKAINFSQNIIGSKHAATIDVWAARLLQRLSGGRRIPSRAETSVGGVLQEDGTTTGQFGLGQDVFALAAKKIAENPRFGDPAQGGHEKLKGMNPDDLQAVVWFLEKERWDRGGWTTAAGAGGSFELEYALLGYPDRKKLADARSILNSKRIRAAVNSGDFSGLTEKEMQEYAWANEVWQDALTYRPARYVLGLSGQMGETQGIKDESGVPTDEQQSGFFSRLRKAARLGDPKDKAQGEQQLLSMRFNSTLGVYGTSGERSIDGELTTRLGFSPRELWKEMCRIGIDRRQDAIFLSRVIRKKEEINYKRHRPGIEIYFTQAGEYIEEQLKPGYTGEKNHITRLLEILRERGIEQYTLVTEPLSPADASSGKMPRVLGIRAQSVPEFDERWGDSSPVLKKDGTAPANWRDAPKGERKKWSELSDDEIKEAITRLKTDWGDIAERINDEVRAGKLRGITFSKQFWYDTRVAFRNEYEGIVNSEDALLQGSARGRVSDVAEGRAGPELEQDAAASPGDTGRGERGAQEQGSGIPEVADSHGRPEVAPVHDSPGRDIREGAIAARDWAAEAPHSKLLTEDVHKPGEYGLLKPDEVYQRAAGSMGIKGSYNPVERIIKFTPKADLSTFAHEHAHDWLNCLLGEGRNSPYPHILGDIDTLLDIWHIGNGSMTREERLQVWDNLGVEGQRRYHEQFASWFEIYLSEGRAPAKGLEGVFQRVAEWLRALYHNAVAKEVGERYKSEIGEELPELSDEVRQVLGHMFQTQDEAAVRAPRIPQAAVAAARTLQTEQATGQKAAAPLANPADPLTISTGRQAMMKAVDDINSGRPVDVSEELREAEVNEPELSAFEKQLDRKVMEWNDEFAGRPGILKFTNKDNIDNATLERVAADPSPGELGYSASNTAADGAPLVAFGRVPEATQGMTSFIWDNGGKVPVTYAVVEASTPRKPDSKEYGESQYVPQVVNKGSELSGLAGAYALGNAENYRGWLLANAAKMGIDADAVRAMSWPALVRWVPPEKISPGFVGRVNAKPENPPKPTGTRAALNYPYRGLVTGELPEPRKKLSKTAAALAAEYGRQLPAGLPVPDVDEILRARAAAEATAPEPAGRPVETTPETPAGIPETSPAENMPGFGGESASIVNPVAEAVAEVAEDAAARRRELAGMVLTEKGDAARVARVIEANPDGVLTGFGEDGSMRLSEVAAEQDKILTQADRDAKAWGEAIACMRSNSGV